MKIMKRSNILIDPRFQLNFLSYTIGLAFVSTAIFYGANQYFFWKFAQRGQEIGLPRGHIFFEFLAEQQSSMNLIFGITGVVSFAALTVGGLLLSHRVAGPLHRFKSHLRDVASGKTMSDVSFREKDYFPEVAADFNQVMKNYREVADKKKAS